MQSQELKKLKMPNTPGVYFFMEGKKILYIGKATSLRDRARSYFGKDLIATRGPLIVDMVWKAKDIKWIKTDSVLEALILEANLIKTHQPYYNTKEKDDKSFNFVCITKPTSKVDTSSPKNGEELPRVIIKRGKDLDKKNYSAVFGPYPNGGQLKEALKIIRKIFPFLDDKSKNYAEFYKQIGLVPDLSDRKLYLQNIRNIKLFFEGKKKEIKKSLSKEMKAYAKVREFEKAGEIKRQIFALDHIDDVALLRQENPALKRFSGEQNESSVLGRKSFQNGIFRIEAYDVAHMSGKNMVGVMVVVEDGEVAKNEYKKFKIRTQDGSNDTGALTEILSRRLAHYEWTYPRLIVVDGSTSQINAAKKVLRSMGLQIPIVSVVKNERHKPVGIKGDAKYLKDFEKEILLANSEAHRFAIAYHKKMRGKNFLGI